LQFAKAGSATALLQQEKNNTVDSPRGRVNITGFICAVVSCSSRRCSFGEFESLAFASRRRRRMFQQLLRRLRLQHKTSAWVSSGPAGGRL